MSRTQIIISLFLGGLFLGFAGSCALRSAPESEDLRGLYVHRCWSGPPVPGCKE